MQRSFSGRTLVRKAQSPGMQASKGYEKVMDASCSSSAVMTEISVETEAPIYKHTQTPTHTHLRTHTHAYTQAHAHDRAVMSVGYSGLHCFPFVLSRAGATSLGSDSNPAFCHQAPSSDFTICTHLCLLPQWLLESSTQCSLI